MADPARPQPVISDVGIGSRLSAAVVAVGGLVLVVRDGVTANNLLTLGSAVNVAVVALVSLVAYLLPLLQAHKAAAKVTPLESPLDGGQPLVPVDVYGKHAATTEDSAQSSTQDSAQTQIQAGYDYMRENYRQPVSDMAIPDAPPVPDPVRPQPFPRTDYEPYAKLRANAPKEDDAPVTALHPLGRIVRHDPRSLQYLVPETSTIQSVMWDRKTPILDQGNLGSCTGNATIGVLGTTPFWDTVNILAPLDEQEAVKVYSLATQLDDVAGTYPPDDTGSSGLGAAQAAKKLGLISGYQHITSVAAAHTAIQQGPFIVGTDWLTGMDNPDSYGVVHATGSIRGGHEYECIGYDAVTDRWWFCNSWGAGWGPMGGRFCYSSADFAKLLANSGDATTFVPITAPAPVPTPVPTPGPAVVPVPADWVTWARHILTLKSESHATQQVAREIIAAAGQ